MSEPMEVPGSALYRFPGGFLAEALTRVPRLGRSPLNVTTGAHRERVADAFIAARKSHGARGRRTGYGAAAERGR